MLLKVLLHSTHCCYQSNHMENIFQRYTTTTKTKIPIVVSHSFAAADDETAYMHSLLGFETENQDITLQEEEQQYILTDAPVNEHTDVSQTENQISVPRGTIKSK